MRGRLPYRCQFSSIMHSPEWSPEWSYCEVQILSKPTAFRIGLAVIEEEEEDVFLCYDVNSGKLAKDARTTDDSGEWLPYG